MNHIQPQLNIHLERGESLAICISRRRNHDVLSHREEGPGRCSISRQSKRFSEAKNTPSDNKTIRTIKIHWKMNFIERKTSQLPSSKISNQILLKNVFY